MRSTAPEGSTFSSTARFIERGAVTVNTDPTALLGPQLGGTDQPGGDVSNFNLTAANPGPKQVVVT
jgi:hypothetical protein